MGHVVRMSDHWLPKILFYGEIKEGKRSRDGPKKRFKDLLKANLKAFNIDPATLESAAQDKTCWRASVRTGAVSCEASRNIAAERRRHKA